MSNIKRLGLAVGLLVIGQSSFAANAQQLAGRCASCHGANGVSSNPAYPNLAGQKAPYLLKQMRVFNRRRNLRNDQREDTQQIIAQAFILARGHIDNALRPPAGENG